MTIHLNNMCKDTKGVKRNSNMKAEDRENPVLDEHRPS